MTATADVNYEQLRRILPAVNTALAYVEQAYTETALLLEPEPDREVAAFAVEVHLKTQALAARAALLRDRCTKLATITVHQVGHVPHLDAAGVPDDYDWVVDVVPFEGKKLKTRRTR